MTLLDKVKLLFKIQKPLTDITAGIAEAKKTKKWLHFAVVALGSAAATAGSLAGFMEPVTALIVITSLTALYNIMRGLDKSDSAEVKGLLRTTEFWMTAAGEIQKGLLALKTGGISAMWLTEAATISTTALAIGQNLAAQYPDKKPE